MMDVASDIAAATGGHIHLLVVTNEHWDHLSGFIQASDVFKSMRVHNLWLAWTEDASNPLAQRLRTAFHDNRKALRKVVEAASDFTSTDVKQIINLLHFFDPSIRIGRAKGSTATVDADTALKVIFSFNASPQYRHPGDALSLPSDNGAPDIPGVHIYVLGPPLSEQKLKDINPPAKGQKVSTQGSALTVQGANQSASDDDPGYPFDQHLMIPLAEAKQYEFFQTYYGFDSAWRRLDDNRWLEAAKEFALQLDDYSNNTSLALAIELVNTKKVLLFVSDAHIGSWLSWDDLSWPVPNATGATQTICIQDLLARTVLYKVSHHGSRNATLSANSQDKKGLELMTHSDLVAMLPVDHEMAKTYNWDMPFDPLLQRLHERTCRRVMRTDDPFPMPQPDGMSDAVWQAFKAHFEEGALYLQYTVTD
jgi:hypothetical protein